MNKHKLQESLKNLKKINSTTLKLAGWFTIISGIFSMGFGLLFIEDLVTSDAPYVAFLMIIGILFIIGGIFILKRNKIIINIVFYLFVLDMVYAIVDGGFDPRLIFKLIIIIMLLLQLKEFRIEKKMSKLK